MKLVRLNIPAYRVLRDIEIDFQRQTARKGLVDSQRKYALDFFAGVNGTGKSTVLRLIGKLFATLQGQDYAFPTPIELVYTTEEAGLTKQITVSNLAGDEENPYAKHEYLRHKVDNEDWRTEQLRPELLPRQIVIYTTGSEREWLEELEPDPTGAENIQPIDTTQENEDRLYLHELPGHFLNPPEEEDLDFSPEKPLLFIRSDRLPLITLCGLLASRLDPGKDEGEILSHVLDSIGLETLLGFSLRIRSQRGLIPIRQQEVIDELKGAADQIIVSGSDHLLQFNLQAQLKPPAGKVSIFSIYPTIIDLFQRLNMLYLHRPYYDPPLQQVNLFLRRKPAQQNQQGTAPAPSMLHLYDWLSDGEQSFLARMALFALFRADNLIILLDEPEVHFNDVWKRQIVDMLDQILYGCASHAVIATHSSIALSDVPPEDILIFRRQEQLVCGREAIRPPEIETFGADPSDILVHVFGTRFASGEHSANYIRREIGRLTTAEDLLKLEKYVAPGYWRYRIRLEAQRLQRLPA